jgi:DMSO/TMAO reductase YedYZ molybdopterin-dependent catalytic subunit
MRVRLTNRQGGRRVDLVLGLLLLAGVITGIAANTIGVNWPLDLMQLHAGAALAILLIAPWKYVVIRRGLARRRRRRSVKTLSLTLLVLTLITIASGLIHSTGHLEFVGPFTLMQIHVAAAFGALAAVLGHFRLHAVRPRRTDADRRALLTFGVLGAAAAMVTAAWDTAGATPRRFSGSVPKDRPEVTSWINDAVPQLDGGTWRVRVGPRTFDLDAVLALKHETFGAVLDCTSGWYTGQQWEGVRLSAVLAAAGVTAGRSVEVRSVTGFSRWFGASTLDDVWLVTRMAGESLSYGHGYPARIVAPGRRGFWWVKWVSEIQPSDRRPWTQPIFPLT